MAYESREVAAFNLALPYLTRVNTILNSNYSAFKNGDSRAFAINLRQLYRELKPWLVIDIKKEIDQIAPLKKAFEELGKINKKNTERLWEKMEDIEMDMRQHFKNLGMLMPKVSDPRFIFGQKQR